MPTDYRSMYDKDYIGAWDLTDGKDAIVTISRVVAGNLIGSGGRKSKKPIVYMRGTEKGFAVNATNGKTIAALYGTHVEDWVGKKIALYKTTTRSPDGDGEVECIRVRPHIPQIARAADPAPSPRAPPPPPGEWDQALRMRVADFIAALGECSTEMEAAAKAAIAPENVRNDPEFQRALEARMYEVKKLQP